MASAADTAAPAKQGRSQFDWSGRLETRHTPARSASLFPELARDGQRRVMIFGDYQTKCRQGNPAYDWSTIWHYNEDGTIDGDTSGLWTLDNRA